MVERLKRIGAASWHYTLWTVWHYAVWWLLWTHFIRLLCWADRERSPKVAAVHRQRDLYLQLVVVLFPAGIGMLTAVALPPAGIRGDWAHVLLILGIASCVLWLLIVVALIRGWPLPGGFVGQGIGSNETDLAVGRECLVLGQSMLDLLAEAKRNAPPLSTFTVNPLASSPDFQRQAQEAGQKSYEYGERIVAQFIERFGVRLASVGQALQTRDLLTPREARQLWSWLRTFPWLERIPEVLVEKARQLGVKP
jgi:hypothetical protein